MKRLFEKSFEKIRKIVSALKLLERGFEELKNVHNLVKNVHNLVTTESFELEKIFQEV